jgi:hypothetical protein
MEKTVGETSPAPDWGHAKQIFFRFAFVYLLIYNITFPLNFLVFFGDFVQKIAKPYEDFWNAVVPWVGSHMFGITVTVHPSGSGDMAYNYVQVFCYLVFSIAATAVWTSVDRRRTNYRRLSDWLRVWVRFALALTMMLYGSVKIVKSQFPYPSLDRLVQPFGDASPMGLLWTFMGASESYNVFTGAGEFLSGLLLTARRTTLLGALIGIGVLSNVVMLNFSYDVPVKQFSLHLLAMAIFLAAHDARRLTNLFLFNRTVPADAFRPLFRWRWLNIAAIVLRTLLVASFAGWTLWNATESRAKFGDTAPKSPLYGIWNVEEFAVDGKARPPLVTDETRWRRLVFDYPKMLGIQLMSDSRQRYLLELDTEKRILGLAKRDDPGWKATLGYQQPEPDVLIVDGKLDGRSILAKLRRNDPKEFLLMSRGFHWVSEYPFNR